MLDCAWGGFAMEAALAVLNEMEASGLVQRYAIGGALAAFFYSEAVVTEDLDVFVLLAPPPGNLVSMTPVYEFLKARAAIEHREHLVLAGILLQIIPAFDPLTEEAVRDACHRVVGNTPTRVMTAEHLVAIALKTGRAKDHGRIALLLEEAGVDRAKLQGILSRHGLLGAWNRFQEKS